MKCLKNKSLLFFIISMQFIFCNIQLFSSSNLKSIENSRFYDFNTFEDLVNVGDLFYNEFSRQISAYGDRKSYFNSDVFAHIVISTLANPDLNYSQNDSIKVVLKTNNGSIDSTVVVVKREMEIELNLYIKDLLPDNYTLKVSYLNYPLESSEFNFIIVDGIDPNLNPLLTSKAIDVLVNNEYSYWTTGSICFGKGELPIDEIPNIEILKNEESINYEIIDTIFWQRNSINTNPDVKWIKIIIETKNVIESNELRIKYNAERSNKNHVTNLIERISLGGTAMGDVPYLKFNYQQELYKLIPAYKCDNKRYKPLKYTIENLENNSIRSVYRVTGLYFSGSSIKTIIKIAANCSYIEVNHQNILDTKSNYDTKIQNLGWSFIRVNDKLNLSFNNTRVKTVNSFKRDSVKVDHDYYRTVESNDINYNSYALGKFKIDDDITLLFEDFNERFPNEVKETSGGAILISSWPSGDVKAFNLSEFDILSFHNLPWIHQKQQGSLVFKMDDWTKSYFINSNSELNQFGINGDFVDSGGVKYSDRTNFDKVPFKNQAISLDFAISLDQKNAQTNFNNILSNIILPNYHDVVSSKIFGNIYKPEAFDNKAEFVKDFASGALEAYKKVVWDNPNHQYGKFTYGIPHNHNTIVPLKEDQLINNYSDYRISPYLETEDLKVERMWNFSHNRAASSSWLNFLLWHDSNKYESIRAFSKSLRDIGTINGGNNLGKMAHHHEPFIPWKNDYHGPEDEYKHHLDLTAHFYAYLFSDDFHALGLYEAYFNRLYSEFIGFGSKREGVVLSGETLKYHSNYHSGKTLLLLNLTMNEDDLKHNASSVLNFQKNFFQYESGAAFIHYHATWLNEYTSQFRDTLRVSNFLNQFYSTNNLSWELHNYKAINHLILSKEIGALSELRNSELAKKTVLNFLNRYLNYERKSKANDNNFLENFSNFYSFNIAEELMGYAPYYLNLIREENIDLLLNNYSSYPTNVYTSTTYNIQTNNLFILDDDICFNFKLTPTFHPQNSIEKIHGITQMSKNDFQFNLLKKRSTIGETTLNSIDYGDINDLEMKLGITGNQFSSTRLDFNTEELIYNDQNPLCIDSDMNTATLITHYASSNFCSPLTNSTTEILEMFGNNLKEDNGNTNDPTYKFKGINTYYFTTLSEESEDTIQIRLQNTLEKENKISSDNIYYRIIYYDQKVDEEETKIWVLNKLREFSEQILYKDILISNEDQNRGPGNFKIRQGIMEYWKPNIVLIDEIPTFFPIVVTTNVSNAEDKYYTFFEFDIFRHRDSEGNRIKAIYPKNTIYSAADIVRLAEFKRNHSN